MRHRSSAASTPSCFVSCLVSYSLVIALFTPFVPRATVSAAAASAKTSAPAPARAAGQQHARREGELLVRFREGVSEESRAAAVESRGAQRKARLRGDGRLERVVAHAGQDAQSLAESLRADPSVELVEPNFLITRAQAEPDDARFGEQWALRNTGQAGGVEGADVRAAGAWAETTGSARTVVAVVDSGIDFTHPDLANQRWRNERERPANGRDDDRNGYADDAHGWDWVTDSGAIRDEQGHGTAVAGVIAAEGNNSEGVSGVMWRASLMSLRVLDAGGAGDVASAVEAIDYAVANGASVINCSWGTEAESLVLRDAVERAGRRGMVVVASAGNGARDLDTTPYYPASFDLPNLISVASTDAFDNLAQFSNWGASRVTVAAPGADVLTTKMGGGHWSVSGTSVSAPLVSGVAGLLRSARPWLSAAQVREAVVEGARRSPSLEGKVSAGGVASAAGALERAGALSPDSFHIRRGEPGGAAPGPRPRPPVGSGGRGPGGGFDAPPRPTNDDDRPPMPNLDEIRSQPSYVPEASSGGTIRSNLPPACGDCYEAPGDDPEFSVSRGLPANETGEPSVDLGSRNFNWALPLVHLPGRAGLDLSLALHYNSLVWTKQGTTVQFNPDDGFPGPGFRLGFPAIQKRFRDTQYLWAYMMVTPSGGRVKLRQTFATSNTYESLDGTYVQMNDLGAGGALVRTADGTRYTFVNTTNGEKRCVEIKDRNGNFITINYNAAGRVSSVRDTLDRVVNFNYDAEGNLSTLTQARAAHGLTDTLAEFIPGSFTVQPSFAAGLTVLGPNGVNVSLLREVRLPDGARYVFDYTPFGQVYKITRLAADGHARSYEGYNLPGSPWAAVTPQTDCPRFTERRDWAEWNVRWQSTELVTRYNNDPSGAGGWTEVTLPDGRTKLKEYFHIDGWRKGLTSRTEAIFDGVVKKWTTVEWGRDEISDEEQRNPRVTQTEVGDAEGNLRRTVVNYVTQSGVSLPAEVREHAKVNGALALARRTATEYRWDAAYTERRIFGLPSLAQTFDAAGALVSKVSYSYDWDWNGDHFQDTPAPAAQHDRANYGPAFIFGRGNLSQAARYDVDDPNNSQDTWRETKWRHNSTGSMLMERDHLWHAVYFDYADSFSVAPGVQTFAYPTRVTDEDGYQSTAKYNYATGAVVEGRRPASGTAAAGNVTYETVATAYDWVGRVSRVTNLNNNAYTRFSYPAAQTYVQTYSTVTEGKPEAYSFEYFDGAGRVFTRAGDHPGSSTNYRAGWTKYDELGRMVEQSNPTEIDSTGAPAGDDAGTPLVWTRQEYDWQGRPTLRTNPDNSTTELSYGGCGCAGGETVTSRDERGRRRKLYKDGLGRLAKVEELNFDQTVYSTAAYGYNARDQLTQISHAGQVRTFEYDGRGRLHRRTTPEQGATTYDYNRDDSLLRTTDARGASATYAYNNRHLPTSITYGVPSGVAATPNVTFEYDAAGSRTRMADGQGHVTYSYDSLSRLSTESRHFTALGQSYPLHYTYDLGGQLTSYTDYRGSKVSYGYDSVGRVASVTGSGPSGSTSYAPALRYRAFDALKSMSYHNGRALSVTYDKRMRVETWDVPAVMGFKYHYESDSHEENTGRVIYAKSLGDATLDRSYEYDHVGRLTVSHTGAEARAHVGIPAGSQWNTLDGPYSHGYEYDVRGNLLRRYGWGGLLGGAPGSSNQQVKTYNSNNRQTDLLHDAAGNVINETSQTFTYDAEGQQATALTYFGLQVNQWYDGDRLRVKKQDGGQTTFYVRSSVLGEQVVAELTGTGAWQRGYVYDSGGGLLAIRTSEGVRWVHQDPTTKSQRLTDASGGVAAVVDLDPWGGETSRSWNSAFQPRKFTTYERDSNADDEAMMRRYSRRHGRFDQPDPYAGSYDFTDPQSFNRYVYVRNDPVNFVDPSGLDPVVMTDFTDPLGVGGFRYGANGVYGGSLGGPGWVTLRWNFPEDDNGPFARTYGVFVSLAIFFSPFFGPQDMGSWKEVTECELFAADVARIGLTIKWRMMGPQVEDRGEGRFADALRDRFAKEGYEVANAEFGSGGFKDEFVDPDPTSANQARHYVGAFRAAVKAGLAGEGIMGWRERSRKGESDVARKSHKVDSALNRVAFSHAQALTSGRAGVNDLANMIRRDVCK